MRVNGILHPGFSFEGVLPERGGYAVENTLYPGQGHAVIADRDTCFDGWFEPVLQLPDSHHTTTALDDEGIVPEGTLNLVQACYKIEFELFSGEFP